MSIDRFQPPLTTEVPVWLAILMKKNNMCSIQCPDWLTVGKYNTVNIWKENK
jgi:GINS complex subunit 2